MKSPNDIAAASHYASIEHKKKSRDYQRMASMLRTEVRFEGLFGLEAADREVLNAAAELLANMSKTHQAVTKLVAARESGFSEREQAIRALINDEMDRCRDFKSKLKVLVMAGGQAVLGYCLSQGDVDHYFHDAISSIALKLAREEGSPEEVAAHFAVHLSAFDKSPLGQITMETIDAVHRRLCMKHMIHATFGNIHGDDLIAMLAFAGCDHLIEPDLNRSVARYNLAKSNALDCLLHRLEQSQGDTEIVIADAWARFQQEKARLFQEHSAKLAA